MPSLFENCQIISQLVTTIKTLSKVRDNIISNAISQGLTWEDLARLDRTSAVKLCREKKGLTLKEAYEKVKQVV